MLLLLAFGSAASLSVASAQERVTVVDDVGRVVAIPSKPMRIVSIAPSITETLFALGLGDRVVGVTRFCNYPPEVLMRVGEGKLTVIGGVVDPSLEKIIGLNPDLVIATNLMKPELVKGLEEAGIPVVVVKTAESIEGIYRDIELIGNAAWSEREASTLIKELRSVIEFWMERVRRAEKVEAAEITWVNPLWVAGNGTYLHDVIEHAGGRNVFSDKSGWVSVSDEELVERDPGVLITPYTHGQELIYVGIMEMKKRGLIHGEVYAIDSDIISRPGPRVAVLFEEVVKALHPEIWSGVIEIRELIAPQRAIVGDLVTIFVEVRNPGNVGGEKIIGMTIDGRSFSQRIELAPGEIRLLNFTFNADKSGTYTITIEKSSTVLNVSPIAEEIVKGAEESLKKYVEDIVSSLRGEVDSLRSGLSGSTAELNAQIDELRILAMASTITSIIAVVAAVVAALLIVRRGKAGG